jgi:hypothetical protein
LNGIYQNELIEKTLNDSFKLENNGIFWKNWLGNSPLKATKMMIRPRDMWFSNTANEDYYQLDDF